MDFNINIRENQLENFQQFIDASKASLNSILDDLGWSENLVKKEIHLVNCPYDSTHQVSTRNLQEHTESCSLKHLGYDVNDVQLSEPTGDSHSSIIIDNKKKLELFMEARNTATIFKTGWNGRGPDPKTAERLMSTFSPDERLVLYKYAIEATKGPSAPPEFTFYAPGDDEKELTYEERLERERDLKRRRIKYKSVHTDHKSHTEIIRELIENHMDVYKEHLHGCNTPRTPEDNPPAAGCNDGNGLQDEEHSITSRNSTHSDASYHHGPRWRHSRERDHRRTPPENARGNRRREDHFKDKSRHHIREKYRERSRSRHRDREGEKYKRKSFEDKHRNSRRYKHSS